MPLVTRGKKTKNPIIEDLEDEREKLYDEGRRLGNEFEDEMRDRFQDLFMQEDEARDKFEDSIEKERKALDLERRELERSEEEGWKKE